LESSKCYKAIIPSELSAVGNTVKEVLKYLHTVCCDIDESILFDIKVILNELIINAIMHGNLQEPSKFVKVYAEVSEGDCVFITIEDEGEGYDYKCLQSKCIDSCSNETLCDLASASVTVQKVAFATGVPPNLYAFHRYTGNSTFLSSTQET
jgi:serine/threonine-protein kinase RsbW